MNRHQLIKTSATATVLASRSPALAAMPSPLPDFQFQSNFWINLHHTLYYQTQVLETVYGLGAAHLPAMDKRAYGDLNRIRGEHVHDWYAALRIYRMNYASLDFVFSDTMVRIDNTLVREYGTVLPGHRDLPAPLRQALTLAAPAYRSLLWPRHDAGNHAFIAELRTKANRFGPRLARRLAQLYRTPWLKEPYIVDVMPYAQSEGSFGNDGDGFFHIAMSADDPVESGIGGLDILFHEASHSTADRRYGTIGSAITAAATRMSRPAPDQFWHTVIMYAPGKLVEELAARNDLGPYAMWSRSLFTRFWPRYWSALVVHFQPYMDGHGSLEGALTACVNEIVSA